MAKARGKVSPKRQAPTKFQQAVYDWLMVTQEFDQWRQQVNQLMSAYNPYATDLFMTENKRTLSSLRLLYEELLEAVKKLDSELSHIDEPAQLTLEQLLSHTETIRQWTRKIQYVLSTVGTGTA
ncbi:MAG: hypothetical protein EOO39_08905 [Cytophagaceae bacterium]|nr:MAG: hypothetical protein EOO39_08905 [Cytophagaceae bacterium]